MAIRNHINTNQEFLLLIIPLFLAEFVRGAYIISYLPSLSIYLVGISLTVIGVAISIHFIGDAITNLISGYMMEHLGSNVVIHLSFFLSTIGLLMVSFWTNTFTIILSSLFLGIGIGPLWLVMLTKASGERRGQNISVVYLGWLSGIGSGMIAMNYIMQFNHESILWLLPSLMVVGWTFYSVVNKGNVSYRQVQLKEQWNVTVRLLKKSGAVMPGILLQGIAMGMLIPILPSFALNELHLTHNHYSLLMLLGGGSAVIFLVPIGKLVDVVTNKVILFTTGFGLFSLALFTLAVSPSIAVTIIVVILLGVFYALFLPSWNTFVAAFIPETLKEASWGIFSSLQGLGIMIGPTIGSLIANQNKTVATIQGSASIFALTAVFYLFYFWRNQKHRGLYYEK